MRGEIDSGSILDQKEATKTYWEGRIIAASMADADQGWETVANVHFQAPERIDTTPARITPPPEFIPAPPPQFDNSPPESLDDPDLKSPQQYVYGHHDQDQEEDTTNISTLKNNKGQVKVVEKKPASQENIIETEIREHQKRELLIRQETESLRLNNRDKGATSPASHESDEGFVDRHPVEDMGPTPPLVETPPLAPSPTGLVPSGIVNSYSQGLRETHRDQIMYDPLSANGHTQNFKPSSESKIAMEIRELREREEELRLMRERLTASRENILEEEEEEADRGSNASSREQMIMDDHLTSLTTTTDEGNFSECGDAVSSEDKSSDGSNSRIMSPDLQPAYHTRKAVTVKPFEDVEEDQPVYTRMKKESVIEREIRIAREREEAFRREKGLVPIPTGVTQVNKNNNSLRTPVSVTTSSPSVNQQQDDQKDVQHRIATSRIQQEINQTSQREKELVDAGKILTLSEDTVDAKVTRMNDLAELPQTPESIPRHRPSSSASVSSECSSSRASLPSPINTPLSKRSASPLSPSYSPYSPPNFTPSPAHNNSGRLTRSLSTNNLSSGSPALRAPKGLMQKFIASRGKLTASAFVSPTSPNTSPNATTNKGVPTRPMKVEPKAAILQKNNTWHQQVSTPQAEPPKAPYRRVNLTAEERIQEELKEMQRREDELRRERARSLAQSQPNLLDLDEDDLDDESSSGGYTESLSFVSTSTYRHEANLRAAHSNPNLLEDDSEQSQQQTSFDKTARRRSALIAQWENRIQQKTET